MNQHNSCSEGESPRCYCVYKHTSPSGKCYIGITRQDPLLRWDSGWGYCEQPKFFNAIKKYGWDSFEHEILERELTQQEAQQKEKAYITQYDSFLNGYNVTLGGEGAYGTHSKKVRCIDTGIIYDSIQSASDSAGINRRCIHQCCTGIIKQTHGLRFEFVNASDLKHNKPHRRIAPLTGANAASTRVCQYSYDRELLETYSSLTNASAATGLSLDAISACCNGSNMSCGGFLWTFDGEDLPPEDNYVVQMKGDQMILKRKTYTILQYTLRGELVAEYASLKDAIAGSGAGRVQIWKSCHDPFVTAGGFHFMRSDMPYTVVDTPRRGPKPVRCIETGEVFSTAREASMATGIHWGSISENCLGKIKSTHGMHFEFVDV